MSGRRPLGDDRGVASVEFAIVLPLLITIFFGGFVILQAVAISRKVTITTRALADLTSQYSQMSSSDMTTVINASSQILAPYNTSPLSVRISEITTNVLGTAGTVIWSAANANATAYKASSAFTLPTGMIGIANTTFVYAETTYTYTPPIGTALTGNYNLGDRIFMLPRLSKTITYSGF